MGKYTGVRQTEDGSLLYQTWRRVRRYPHCKEFDDFLSFYSWAIRSGYTPGAWLKLIEKDEPYDPENCEWRQPERKELLAHSETFVRDWNKTVNTIRKHCGLEPLKGTTYDETP